MAGQGYECHTGAFQSAASIARCRPRTGPQELGPRPAQPLYAVRKDCAVVRPHSTLPASGRVSEGRTVTFGFAPSAATSINSPSESASRLSRILEPSEGPRRESRCSAILAKW